MAREPSTRLQRSTQRFLTRRMTHALVRRDVGMVDDPMRAQSRSLAAGSVLAVIALAVCAVLALIRPAGVPASAPIVMARDSGALYVRIGDTLHPALNLASARLLARSAANPAAVNDAAVAAAKRGPLVGIPGAPATIGEPVRGPVWTVCDHQRTVVTIGTPDLTHLDASRAVLVTPRGESAATTYLLYEGQRAEVDLRDTAVVRALHLDGVAPMPVSRTLLDIVPEAPAIAPPRIEGIGGIGPPPLGGTPVGAVVRVLRADTAEHYVVLADGVQSIGEVTADLIRFTYDRRASAVPTVAPAAIAATPVATALPVETFPRRVSPPIGAGDDLAVCAQWRAGRSMASSNTIVLNGESSDVDGGEGGALAQADGTGPNIDAVVVPAGRSAYVRSSRIVGDDGATGPRFLIADSGVAFGVHDDDAAKFLGLGESPDAAPWPILVHLPRGPELSTDAASVVRDGLSPPA